MRKLFASRNARLFFALVAAILPFGWITLASADSLTTFVSGRGADSGTCASPTSPCRTFQFALGVTKPGGEIKALDPANYGRVDVGQSVSITGIEGASIDVINGHGISVSAGATDVVNISNVTFDGHSSANYGLIFTKAGSLNINNCAFRNFASHGIFIQPPTGTTSFRIADVVASDNGGSGFYFLAQNSALTNGVLERVRLNHNANGVYATRSSNSAKLNMVVSSSAATNNQSIGFLSGAQGTFLIRNSVATGNVYGLYLNTVCASAGDNILYGNTSSNILGGCSAVSPN